MEKVRIASLFSKNAIVVALAVCLESEPAIRQSLAMFGGVKKSSLKFDQKAKKLTLRYDSMQLAKKNIEMAIAKAGFEANGVTPESVGTKK